MVERPVEPVQRRPAKLAVGALVIRAVGDQKIPRGKKFGGRHWRSPWLILIRNYLGDIVDDKQFVLGTRLRREAAHDQPGAVMRVLADFGEAAVGQLQPCAGSEVLDREHR